MNTGQTVFRKLLQFLPCHEFNCSVRRYRGEYRARSFTAFDQFLYLAYAQLSDRESLRDIETCLNSHREKLYQNFGGESVREKGYILASYGGTQADPRGPRAQRVEFIQLLTGQ